MDRLLLVIVGPMEMFAVLLHLTSQFKSLHFSFMELFLLEIDPF
jgi:hypothetical protein